MRILKERRGWKKKEILEEKIGIWMSEERESKEGLRLVDIEGWRISEVAVKRILLATRKRVEEFRI